MAEGVDGLLRDKTRPPGTAPLATSLVDKVVALTLQPPSHEGDALDGARHGEKGLSDILCARPVLVAR